MNIHNHSHQTIGSSDLGITDWEDKLKTGKKVGTAQHNGDIVAMTRQNEGNEIVLMKGNQATVYELNVTEKGKAITQEQFLSGLADIDPELMAEADGIVIATEDGKFTTFDADGKAVNATPVEDNARDYDMFMFINQDNFSPKMMDFVKENYTHVRMIEHNLRHLPGVDKHESNTQILATLQNMVNAGDKAEAQALVEKLGVYYPQVEPIQAAFEGHLVPYDN